MNEQEQYDSDRAEMENIARQFCEKALETGMYPAAVLSGVFQAAGKFAHEHGIGNDVFRLVMKDMARDAGVDPSRVDDLPMP